MYNSTATRLVLTWKSKEGNVIVNQITISGILLTWIYALLGGGKSVAYKMLISKK